MIISFCDLLSWRRAIPREKRLVVTNGCFDVLHYGHIRYLQEARNLGDLLLVGINSDLAVRSLKGQSRPVINERMRALTLDELKSVDYVCVFDSVNAAEFLDSARPNIYVKGGDYSKASLNKLELDVLATHNSEILISPLVEGLSTTSILDRISKP